MRVFVCMFSEALAKLWSMSRKATLKLEPWDQGRFLVVFLHTRKWAPEMSCDALESRPSILCFSFNLTIEW